MRVRCPLDEGLHLLVWHLIPALAGIALAAFLGSLLFKRRIRD
jgi:LPXTG-motif cell wall-anchored protein